MIKYNPQFKSDGTQNGALTSAPSDSIIFDVPGKCIWVKGVKLATSHTYTFSHDNYITLTNTPGEPEDILIGVNTTALKNAIDTTYGVVSASADGLAPKFSNANKATASAATTYNFLGIAGSTLKWYQLPWRNVRINAETSDVLGINNTDPLIISSGNGIEVSWDSTNKKIVITNTKPDINHNTDTHVSQLAASDNADRPVILKQSATTENEVGSVRYTSTLLYNPSTKILKINGNRVVTFADTYVGATSSANATTGLVPVASSANRNKFLRGDGTWLTPSDYNTWRPVKVGTTDALGSGTDTGALVLAAGTGISLSWDSTNKQVIITNSSPDVNHNTDKTGVKLGTVSGTKKTDGTVIITNSSAGLTFQGGTNLIKIGDGTNYIEVPITISHGLSTKNMTINGTAYALYTSASSLPTFIAPTSFGTANYILATNSSGNGFAWVAKPTSNVTTDAVVSNSATGTTQITTAQGNPYYNLLEGGSVTRSIRFVAGTGITISAATNGLITITNSAPDVNHDTHYTTHLYIGKVSEASNAAIGNPYLKLYDNSTLRHQYQLKGDGASIKVDSDSSGNLTTKLGVIYCRGGSSPSNSGVWNTIKNGTSSPVTDSVRFYTIYNDGGPTTYGEMLEILSYNSNHWQPQLWFGAGRGGHMYYRNKDYSNNTWGSWLTIADSGNISNKDATIGTSLTTIATIAGVDITAKIGSYAASSHTHSVKINGSTKTIAAPGGTAVDLGNYIISSGFASSGSTSLSTWGTLKTDNGYTGVLNINDPNGGSWEIAYKGGQQFHQIDGCYYQNEGRYRVLDVSDVSNKDATLTTSLTTIATIAGTDIKAKITVVDKSAEIGTSLTTIATIAGIDIKAKIASYSLSDHTHPLSIAADSGTNQLTLAPSSKYKLTAGGSTFIFTTPTDENVKQTNNDNNQDSPILLKNGTGTGNITSGTIFADGVTVNPYTNSLKISGSASSILAIRGHRLGYRHLDAGPKSSWSDSRLYIGYNGFSDDDGVTDSIGFYRSTGTGTYTRTLWAEINSNGLYANTRFGVNGQNTGYNFYVNGTSFLNNTVRIQYNTPNLYIRNTVDTSYSIIRLGTNSNENASYIFQNGPSRTDDGGANTMTIRNNVGVLRLQNRIHIDSTGRVYPEGTDSRRAGMYGVYDSYKIGHIWSMGTAYMIPDNGANFGNLYGLAYKHTNNTTGGAMGGGHQMVWCANGTPFAAMGEAGIWSRQWLHVNGINSGTDNGITLYNREACYGIMFRQTSNLGTHGYVSGDWATYFTMSDSNNRGWVFRRWGNKNVASISTDGNAYFNGHIRALSSASSWIDGQRYNYGGYNLLDATDTGSYWPWMRQTNTGSSKWFSMGVLNNSLYIIGSTTSRTANSYDYGWRFDVSNGWAYGNFLNSDTLDGIHANGLLTAASLGASGNSTTLSVTVGGTTKTGSVTVPYASSAGSVAWGNVTGKPGAVGSASIPVYWTGSGFGTCIVSFGNSSNGEHNANSITDNGIKYYTSNGPSGQLGARSTDGALYSQAYNTSWVAQIAQDYRDGGLYVRGRNNGTWQKWLQVMLVDLTSSAVTNCNSVYRTGIYTHSGFSNRPSGVTNWGTLLNYKLYEDNNSYHRQIFLDCYGTNRIWTRANNGGTWTGWVELVRNTGTWSINITGNAATATSATNATVWLRTWQRGNDCNVDISGSSWHNQTRVFMYDSSTANKPSSGAGFMIMNAWDWGGGGALLAQNFDDGDGGRLYTKYRQCGDNTAWSGWNKVAFVTDKVADSDKVDGIHANGLLTAASLGASGNSTTLSVTVGGTTKTGSVTVPYATLTGTVTVNNSDANSTYRMVWHSGNTLYSTGGIYCNPYTDTLYATRIIASYGNFVQTSMRHIDAGLNSVHTDHGLYIGYGAQTYTAVTHFYYSTGSTDSTSSRTEFMQINSNGAYALTRFGVNGQNTSYNFYVNGTTFGTGSIGTNGSFYSYSTAPMIFYGSGSGTYDQAALYVSQSDGITFETPRASNSGSAAIRSFQIKTRGGLVAPLVCGSITCSSIQGDSTSNRAIFRHLDGLNCNGNYDLYLQYHVTGAIRCCLNVYAPHYYENSDAKLKHDISSISQSIRKFRFNNDNKLYYGFIAQELETLHPELVDNSGEYKTVNYNSAICLVISKLENRVKELEDKLKKYEEIQNI